MTAYSISSRQIRIQKPERMRRLDYAHSSGTLLFGNLSMQRLHSRPMHLWPEVMFGVVTIVKPRPVIQLPVSAYAPRNRLVGIAAVMPIVAVQVREAVAEIPERQKKTDVMPVKDPKDDKRRDETHQLEYSPKRLARTLPFQFLEDSFWVLAKETDEGVFQRMLRIPAMAVLVNRNPIDRLTMLIGPVGVSLVMLHVNALVKNLAEPDSNRFHDAE